MTRRRPHRGRPGAVAVAFLVGALALPGCSSPGPRFAPAEPNGTVVSARPDLFPSRDAYVGSTRAKLSEWEARAGRLEADGTTRAALERSADKVRALLGELDGAVVAPWNARRMRIDELFDQMARAYHASQDAE